MQPLYKFDIKAAVALCVALFDYILNRRIMPLRENPSGPSEIEHWEALLKQLMDGIIVSILSLSQLKFVRLRKVFIGLPRRQSIELVILNMHSLMRLICCNRGLSNLFLCISLPRSP